MKRKELSFTDFFAKKSKLIPRTSANDISGERFCNKIGVRNIEVKYRYQVPTLNYYTTLYLYQFQYFTNALKIIFSGIDNVY